MFHETSERMIKRTDGIGIIQGDDHVDRSTRVNALGMDW